MVWASRHTWYLRAPHLSAKRYFTSLFKINFIRKQLLHIQHSTENLRPRAWKPHCDSYTTVCASSSLPPRASGVLQGERGSPFSLFLSNAHVFHRTLITTYEQKNSSNTQHMTSLASCSWLSYLSFVLCCIRRVCVCLCELQGSFVELGVNACTSNDIDQYEIKYRYLPVITE